MSQAEQPYAYDPLSEPWPEPSAAVAALLAAAGSAEPGELASLRCPRAEQAIEALDRAAFRGLAQSLARLIPLALPLPPKCQALRLAVLGERPHCLEILAPHFELASRNRALALAAETGKTDCLKRLLPFCDPKAGDSVALRMAATRSRLDCLRLLLPLSDASARGYEALMACVESRQREACLEIISQSPPPPKAARALADIARSHQLNEVAEALEALCERSELSVALPGAHSAPKRPSL